MAIPIGLNINNPNTQESSIPTSTQNTVVFGGNALGSGASTSSSASLSPSSSTTDPLSSLPFSSILLYGAIGLGAILVLKKASA